LRATAADRATLHNGQGNHPDFFGGGVGQRDGWATAHHWPHCATSTSPKTAIRPAPRCCRGWHAAS